MKPPAGPDPVQLELPLAAGKQFAAYGPGYSRIAQEHVADMLGRYRAYLWQSPYAAAVVVNGGSGRSLTAKFADAGLPPINPEEIMRRAQATVSEVMREDARLQGLNRRVTNPAQSNDVARVVTGRNGTLALPMIAGGGAVANLLADYGQDPGF